MRKVHFLDTMLGDVPVDLVRAIPNTTGNDSDWIPIAEKSQEGSWERGFHVLHFIQEGD